MTSAANNAYGSWAGIRTRDATDANIAHLSPLSTKAIDIAILLSATVAGLCLVARLYTRFCVVRQPGWDDLCVTIGSLCTLGTSIAAVILNHNGLGQHIQDIPLKNLVIYLKCNYVGLGLYTSGSGFLKTAILLQFLRLLQPKTVLYKIIQGFIAFVVVWCLAFSFVAWFPCFPVARSWDDSIKGHCYGFGAGATDLRQFWITLVGHAATNMAGDVVILGLAGYVMGQVSTDRGVKLRIAVLLFVGIAVNGCAIARTCVSVYYFDKLNPNMVSDLTFQESWGVLLLGLEINLAVICATVPVFWSRLEGVFKKEWDKIFITREVTVLSTPRYPNLDERDNDWQSSSRPESFRSNADMELLKVVQADSRDMKSSHYEDEFIQSQVDPLRQGTAGSALVTTNYDKGKNPRRGTGAR